MVTFDNFLQKVFQLGLEAFHIYYSVYRGQVVDVSDPEDRGRVRATVPGAGIMEASTNIWIPPAGLFGAGRSRGWFWPPEVGDTVWVAFAQGQARYPLCYWGGYFGQADNQTEVPTELRPDSSNHRPYKRGFLTRRGHRLIFNEKPGEDSIELSWHKPQTDNDQSATPSRSGGQTSSLKFLPDGSIEAKTSDGSAVKLDVTNGKVRVVDKTGNALDMSSSGVVIDCGARSFEVRAGVIHLKGATVNVGEGASASSPLGEDLLQWLASHTHGTGVGPSSPPVVPPTPSLNSATVKVRR